jgi:hypothetical protein
MASWFFRDPASSSPTKPCYFRWRIPELSTEPPWRQLVSELAVFDRKEPNSMTPELSKDDGRPEGTERDVTRRIGHETAAEPPEVVEPEKNVTNLNTTAQVDAFGNRIVPPLNAATAARDQRLIQNGCSLQFLTSRAVSGAWNQKKFRESPPLRKLVIQSGSHGRSMIEVRSMYSAARLS